MRFAWIVVVAGCGHYDFTSAGDARGTGDTLVDTTLRDGEDSDVVIAPSTCAGQNVILCEGFEAALGSQWQVIEQQGSLSPITTRSLRGEGSLEVLTDASTTVPDVEIRGDLPLTTGQLYARVWIYAPSPFPAAYDQFLTLVESSQGEGIAFGVEGGLLVINDFSSGPTYVTSATAMPLDRWFCLTVSVPSNTGGTNRVYLDDVELTNLRVDNGTTVQAPADQVIVGQFWGGNSSALPATTMQFDELIVDDAPITCAQ